MVTDVGVSQTTRMQDTQLFFIPSFSPTTFTKGITVQLYSNSLAFTDHFPKILGFHNRRVLNGGRRAGSSKMAYIKNTHLKWTIVLVFLLHALAWRVAGFCSSCGVGTYEHVKHVTLLQGRKIGRSRVKVAMKAQGSQEAERAPDDGQNLVETQQSSTINSSPSYAPLASSMALVAGNAVGAGVLALPETSFPAGFGPSAAVR